MLGAVVELDEPPRSEKGIPNGLAGHADAERAGTSHVLGVQESAERVLFATLYVDLAEIRRAVLIDQVLECA